MPLLLELRKEEYFGLEKPRDGGQRFKAEVSSSRISQLRLEVTENIPATRVLLSSLSCFLQVQSP